MSNGFFRAANRVLISTSTNVYKNLAFERYLAENIQHEHGKQMLLLWRNEPCVVIGRYQNPFVECDIKYLKEKNVFLARRYSGGGEYRLTVDVQCRMRRI